MLSRRYVLQASLTDYNLSQQQLISYLVLQQQGPGSASICRYISPQQSHANDDDEKNLSSF